ncbi:hypothetical protein A6V29_05610 [Blastococcus sp. CCUG 61487]|nr:hypothetical protein A6V29_05610 [Blastococcus sp. CCUG 61487]
MVSVGETDTAFAARWRALEDVATAENPFYSADFLRAAATHLPSARGMRLLVGENDGELGWLIPLVPSRRLLTLPVVGGLRNRWPHVFFGQPLVAPGCESEAADHLLAHLSERRAARWLRLHYLDADDAFTRALLRGVDPARVQVERYTRGWAVRRADPTYLEGHSNLRRLSRKRRAFERETGEVLRVLDRSDDPAALEEFLVLEASGWKGREGRAFLATTWDAAFLRQVADAFRRRGQLQLWSLQSGAHTLAMKLNLVTRSTMFCYLIAYDEKVAALSPGLQLEVENFDLFHSAADVHQMDSCATPDNGFVNRLYPEQRALLSVLIGSGVAGRAVTSLAAVRAGQRAPSRHRS